MNAVLLQCTSKHSEMMPLKRGAALPSSEAAGGGWYLCTDRTSKTRKRAPTLSDSACEIRPVGRSKTQFISTAQRSVSVSVGQTMRSFSSCNKNNFAFLHCSENIDIKMKSNGYSWKKDAGIPLSLQCGEHCQAERKDAVSLSLKRAPGGDALTSSFSNSIDL